MSSKKDPLAGKGPHRKIVQQLFEKASPETKKLMAAHLTARRERLRLDFMKEKARNADTDAYQS